MRVAKRTAMGATVGAILMLTMVAPKPAGAARGASGNPMQVATWNIYGGYGNAYSSFNPYVAPFGGSNTVQTRIKARWPNLYGLGLQEVCETQYNAIRFDLYVSGYWLNGSIGGPGGYTDKFVLAVSPLIGSDQPSAACGDWFGSAVYIGGTSSGAGGRFASQNTAHLSKSGWVCLWSLAVVCSSHLSASSVNGPQATELQDVGNFLLGTGLRTFILADFNAQPGLITYDWTADGWRDADQYSGGISQATTHSGLIIDYVWSKNPNTWHADAWVPHSSAVLSDHYWKQGYF